LKCHTFALVFPAVVLAVSSFIKWRRSGLSYSQFQQQCDHEESAMKAKKARIIGWMCFVIPVVLFFAQIASPKGTAEDAIFLGCILVILFWSLSLWNFRMSKKYIRLASQDKQHQA